MQLLVWAYIVIALSFRMESTNNLGCWLLCVYCMVGHQSRCSPHLSTRLCVGPILIVDIDEVPDAEIQTLLKEV